MPEYNSMREKKKKKEKDDKWWLLWVLSGCLGALCFLFVVAGVATLIAYVVDIDEDVDHIESTTDWIHMSVNSTEETVNQINNTVNWIHMAVNITEDPSCDDGNVCTFDALKNELCHNYNLPNDTPCTSSCLAAQSTCQAGECTGGCLGSCFLDEDCPVVADILGANLTATCYNSVCTYNTTNTDPFIQSSPCTFDSLDAETCMSVIDPLTFKDCLVAHPYCTSQGPPSDLSCLYTFACADPVVVPL